MSKTHLDTTVLIIGGGATGTGLARDLALRGIDCMVVERWDINAGASGGNHGLLHSGARYVLNDAKSAAQCKTENDCLKRLLPECIEDTGGIFGAVAGDDENYIADFPGLCTKAGVPFRELDVDEAREMEPNLSESLIAAFEVSDATIDPFGFSLANIADARLLGARLLLHTEITAIKTSAGSIQFVSAINTQTGTEYRIKAKIVVSAAGAWSGLIASMAGVGLNMSYSKGSLLVTSSRITERVINRLRPPADADILVPGGTVSIVGTTSTRIDSPDDHRPSVEEVQYIIDDISGIVPILDKPRYIRAYAGVRPLIQQNEENDDRSASREFELLDHGRDGLHNFITITSGKLTTFRYMAEKTADLICRKLEIDVACTTAESPFSNQYRKIWTMPGFAPKNWVHQRAGNDTLLCECEMVSKSAIDSIITDLNSASGQLDLRSIGLRSRVGKGPCQGGFCSIRTSAYLYDRQLIHQDQGIDAVRDFLSDRWTGQQPVLWGSQLAQAELSEAMHCGYFCLEQQEQQI